MTASILQIKFIEIFNFVFIFNFDLVSLCSFEILIFYKHYRFIIFLIKADKL